MSANASTIATLKGFRPLTDQKAVVVYIHDRSFNSFADRIIRLEVR